MNLYRKQFMYRCIRGSREVDVNCLSVDHRCGDDPADHRYGDDPRSLSW